jgi:cephalosporin-C deacetylase-like acetyl esterase
MPDLEQFYMLAHRLRHRRLVRRCTWHVTLTLGVVFLAAAGRSEAQQPLSGTQPLTWTGDLSLRMVDDLHAYADRATAASIERRARHWKRDFSSVEAYRKSIEGNRKRLAKYLGASDPTVVRDPIAAFDRPGLRILSSGITGDGKMAIKGIEIEKWFVSTSLGDELEVSLLRRKDAEKGPLVILLGDAVQEPLHEGVHYGAFLERGFMVAIPRLLVDRSDDFSLVAGTKRRPQSHREYIYRQAFEMGRHVIGYELDALRELIDLLAVLQLEEKVKVAVVGYGEGGMLALYAGALDPRIDVVGVSGYFGPREGLHDEPIYRNVWGLLDEFGDAELAAMVAPNRLIIEAADVKEPAVDPKVDVARITPGKLTTPKLSEVQREVDRALKITAGQAAFADRITLVGPTPPDNEPWSKSFVDALAKACYDGKPFKMVPIANSVAWRGPDEEGRKALQKRFIDQFVEKTQALVRESEYVRKDYFKNADKASRDPAKWEASLGPYRKHLYEEVLGKIDSPLLPPNARTRQVYDTPKYTGYEVVLDVFDNDADKPDANVFAFGVLLVPKHIKAGEKRPVVVCQHGLEGRPRDTIEANEGERYYHRFAHLLAERGFVTFSPQNPYIGKNHFRQLVRKLNPLKLSLWSIIVPQHEQITTWLAGLDFVDPTRIGFYGLSYGGKTAMRVPALVPRYCLSICSGDFNEWIRKITSVRDAFSYMGTGEYEIFEFDMGHTFNYAELAYLIAPRPFMVERGHRDGVGIDEWVGYEYGKVRLLYADLKIPERTEIEYFDGPHEIHSVGTFDFLHRHLKWAAPK